MRAENRYPTQKKRRETDEGWWRDERNVADVGGNDEQRGPDAAGSLSASAGELPKALVGARVLNAPRL